jgi:hypothetical protein
MHLGGPGLYAEFLFDVTQDAFKALYIFGIMLHSLLGERGFAEPLEGIDVSIYKYIQKTHPEVITMLPSEMGIPPEIL